MRQFLWATLLCALATGASAQAVFQFPEDEAESTSIANEVIATFYHELGHAQIDVLDLPVLGKQEYAADHRQAGQSLADLIAEEVAGINERFGLPEQVSVVLADCGEASAFYSPGAQTITICNEYAQNLQAMWEASPD